jgi:ribose transport system ATP-binding protein
MLKLAEISKRFGGVVALDKVSLSLAAGEVLALIGENGAGKSTLMKILGGVHTPDSGEILLNEKPVHIRSVSDAVALGVGFVHQELNLLDNLDVSGNIFLGREPARMAWAGPLRWLDRKAMLRESLPHLERLGLRISPAHPLAGLSLAQRQMVEIAKALSLKARILILDEPSSSLTSAETGRLLEVVKELSRAGVAVVYISHRLGEIGQIAHRVVALRDGKNAGELAHEQINHNNMVRLMIGRELRNLHLPPAAAPVRRLEIRQLRTAAWPKQTVNFDAEGGEILGMAGLVGAGRSELAAAIFGVEQMLGGEIVLDGNKLSIRSSRDAIDAGIYLVPEDRRRYGLLLDSSVRENISLPQLRRCATLGIVRARRELELARNQIRGLQIKTPGVETRVANLSGGTQQKVVLGKWLAMKPKVLIVDEPTRGIDVGTKAEIYRLLRALADQGVAVIAISSDLEEILGISDRLIVMREGAIAGILNRPQFSERAVMDLAFWAAA